jgi:hypothetical protein
MNKIGIIALWLAVGVFGAAGNANAAVYRVGSGPGCTHTTLSDAVRDAFPSRNTTIYITRTASPGGAFIVGNFEISGGFDDCLATSPTGRTVIDAGGQSRLFLIGEARGGTNVKLRNLELIGGRTDDIGGAILVKAGSQGEVRATLSNVWIHGNRANKGGAIALTQRTRAPAILALHDTRIYDNEAADRIEPDGYVHPGMGGGIHCEGGESSVILSTGTVISRNRATEGGGLRVFGCGVRTEGSLSQFGDGFFDNRATHGAGIDALGAVVDFSSPGSHYEIAGNRATQSGGGIRLRAGASLDGSNLMLTNNHAGDRGGALAVEDGSLARIYSRSGCSRLNCGTLKQNSAGRLADAAWVLSGTLKLVRAEVSGNGVEGSDAIIVATGASEVSADGLVATANRGRAIFAFHGHSTGLLEFLTVHGNHLGEGEVVRSHSQRSVFIRASILSEEFPTSVLERAPGSPIGMQCLLTHEAASIPDAGQSIVSKPFFIDAAAANFRLASDSPAIDFCTPVEWDKGPDMDNRPRRIDADWVPNRYGVFDLGAYEVQSYTPPCSGPACPR